MKKNYRTIGIVLYVIGFAFILWLLAIGLNIISIENDRILALIIFIAVVVPSLGAILIRKGKNSKKSSV